METPNNSLINPQHYGMTTMKLENPKLFNRLLLRQKFAILGLIAFILVAVPFYYFFKGEQQRVNNALLGQTGLKPARELLSLLNALPRHRGSSTGLLSGNAKLADEEKTTKALADQYIANFDAMSRAIEDAALLAAWQDIKDAWPVIARDVETRAVTPPQNFQAHTHLIMDVHHLLGQVTDYYGLSLNPDAESNFLMRAVLMDGPLLTEYLGQARGWGTGLLAKAAKQDTPGAVTLADKTQLTAMTSLVKDHLAGTRLDIEKTGKAAATLKASLDQPLLLSTALIEKALHLSEAEIVNADAPLYSSSDYYQQYTQAIEATYKLIDAGFAILGDLFAEQVATARQAQLAITGLIAALLLIGIVVSRFIAGSITNPMSQLLDVINKLAGGDASVRANMQRDDEIGLLARQFDIMVDQREAARTQIQRENEQLNESVIDLLQAVAKISQKDLTVKVPVAEDITAPVADALNLLSGETAKVLQRVVHIAGEVATVSQQVQAQSETVIGVASAEKHEVEQAAAELSAASAVMLDIAQLALTCNAAAEKAIKNTDKAQQTVLGTVQGINTIRDTIRETEKRIKRLGERSQEIGGVVNLINNIAERTHILALNAAMHAASAGEAGRGFAVVANEVQRLAENAREATSKIAALVSNIQLETADTVVTMNEAISQVVRGTDLAQQAGDEMRETRDTTANLVQLVQRIAEDSKNQAETTLRLQQRAEQIQKSTQQTYEQLQDQGKQTERLVDFSGGLVQSVGVFVLPELEAAAGV